MMRSMPSFYFPIAGENFSLHCISKQKMGQQKQDRAENQYQRCDDRSWRSSLSLKPKYTVDGAWDPYCLCWWAHASQAWSQSCPPGVSHIHSLSSWASHYFIGGPYLLFDIYHGKQKFKKMQLLLKSGGGKTPKTHLWLEVAPSARCRDPVDS